MNDGDFASAREAMVQDQLKARGISDPEVLAAMGRVPRHLFVPEHLRIMGYGDFPLLIPEEQTVSQPYIVALMTEALGPLRGRRVLELGTGAGYQTAILLEVGATVVSIERHESLAASAEVRLRELGYQNFEVHCADGTLGWVASAPYDAILSTAAAPELIEPLLDQLTSGGVLVIPVGDRRDQRLLRVIRSESGTEREDLGGVVFLPLVGEKGFD